MVQCKSNSLKTVLENGGGSDRRTARRLLELMRAVLRDPFQGIGKPEPPKYFGLGVWFRRITQEHRCVYLVKGDITTELNPKRQ